MPARYPLGISDFIELRSQGCTYVDKTLFIADVLDRGAKVVLHPRPRRFGKTLNLSTMRAFCELNGGAEASLFSDTEVWSLDGGRLRTHFQRYPVIAISFKDVKARRWSEAWVQIHRSLTQELRRLRDLHPWRGLPHVEEVHTRFLHPAQGPVDLQDYLGELARWLRGATGEPAIIIIDEYDAPLHSAWQHGYWQDAIDFFRSFLASGLKDEPSVFRGVLSGILKVAKENIFSGLNNVRTHSILDPEGATRFGFTAEEVRGLLSLAGQSAHLEEVRQWYDGYRFGGAEPELLYNPWSILSWLDSPGAGFQAFWRNTSSNDLVRELLMGQAAEIGPDLSVLVGGGAIERRLDESVPLQELRHRSDALWALLTYTGYLTVTATRQTDAGPVHALTIPNREVLAVFRETFLPLVAASGEIGGPGALATAMLAGDAEAFRRLLEDALVGAMSHHDFGAQRPVEAVHQAFIVGLLVHLEASHRVVSNREAGHGRADVLIIPRAPGPGVVLELKALRRGASAAVALERAVAQRRDRDYAAELRAAGATAVHQYALAFDGKRCWIQEVEAVNG